MKILVTGAAGFIGFHLCEKLLEEKYTVLGVDNINNYYDVKLKKDRLKILLRKKNFKFKKLDISDNNFVKKIYPIAKNFKVIIHLAAQAGVRYSITHPYKYIESNVKAQISILELAKKIKSFEHLIYASSSSVYGTNKKIPFSINDRVDSPASLYGASKRAGELITQSYSRMFNINCTGLRFFSVYGPWGRPDMAAYIFTKNIFQNKTLDLFNFGRMERDHGRKRSGPAGPARGRLPILRLGQRCPDSVDLQRNRHHQIITTPVVTPRAAKRAALGHSLRDQEEPTHE